MSAQYRLNPGSRKVLFIWVIKGKLEIMLYIVPFSPWPFLPPGPGDTL